MILLEMWRTSYIDTRTGLFTYVMSGETEDLASFYTDVCPVAHAQHPPPAAPRGGLGGGGGG
jgi:hypothetical protein